jgi:AmmeMemoRadiSam system protein B
MSIRRSAHAGAFYPDSAETITDYIRAFDKVETLELKENIRAFIVPHAGYIYSGFTANLAYMQLRSTKAKRAIVIGPSHRVAFEGMSISLYESYETPFGALEVDLSYAQELKERFGIAFEESMHFEHSTEVQMPFIKYYAPQMKVIEMVYGFYSPQELSKIIIALLEDPDNLVVISTDLSHFYTEEEANRLDDICMKAIDEQNVALLHQGCEACGKIGVEAVLMAARALGLRTKLLDHRTSAWATNDRSSVVGYGSAVVYSES